MDLKVEKELYDSIAKEIHSDSSPVGIDAKKTHNLNSRKINAIRKTPRPNRSQN